MSFWDNLLHGKNSFEVPRIWTSGLWSLVLRWLTEMCCHIYCHLTDFSCITTQGSTPEQTYTRYCMVWFTTPAGGRRFHFERVCQHFKKKKKVKNLYSQPMWLKFFSMWGQRCYIVRSTDTVDLQFSAPLPLTLHRRKGKKSLQEIWEPRVHGWTLPRAFSLVPRVLWGGSETSCITWACPPEPPFPACFLFIYSFIYF